MELSDQISEFERRAANILELFERLWTDRDASLIREIVAEDAVSHWSGLGEIAGHDYPERWHALVNDSVDELQFTITGRAAQDPYLFISWQVRATKGDRSVTYDGVDRFTIRGARAEVVYVVFDPTPMRDLLQPAHQTL